MTLTGNQPGIFPDQGDVPGGFHTTPTIPKAILLGFKPMGSEKQISPIRLCQGCKNSSENCL